MDLTAEIDDDFARYFRSRGVRVTWDLNVRAGLYWYELLDEKGLVCQVDFGAPLEEFLTDIPHFIAGRDGVGPTDYEMRCPDNERLRRLYERLGGLA